MGKIMQAAEKAQQHREALRFEEDIRLTKRLVAAIIVKPALGISEREAERLIKHYPYSCRVNGSAVVSVEDGITELAFTRIGKGGLRMLVQDRNGYYFWQAISSLADLAELTPASFEASLGAA